MFRYIHNTYARYFSSPKNFFLSNTLLAFWCIALSSFFNAAGILVFAAVILLGFIGSLFAIRRPLLNGVLPAILASIVLLILFFTTSNLYPLGAVLLISFGALTSVFLFTLLGALLALPLRKHIPRSRLMQFQEDPNVVRAQKKKQLESAFSENLKRFGTVVLLVYIQMHVLVPIVGRAYAGESVSVDQAVEQYDPAKKYSTSGKDANTPVDKKLPKDEGSIAAKEKAEQKTAEQKKEKPKTSKQIQKEKQKEYVKSLEKKKLKYEQLLKLYEQKKLSKLDMLYLLGKGVKNGSISWKKFFEFKTYKAAFQAEMQRNPQLKKAVETVQQEGLTFNAVWQGVKAADSYVTGGVATHIAESAADAAVDMGKGMVTFAKEHPILATAMVGAVVASFFLPAVALAITVLGITLMAGMMVVGFATGGVEGMLGVIFSQETIDLYKSGDLAGAFGRALVEGGMMTLGALGDVAVLARSLKLLQESGKIMTFLKMVENTHLVTNQINKARTALAGLQNMGKLTLEGQISLSVILRMSVEDSATLERLVLMLGEPEQSALLLNTANNLGKKASVVGEIGGEKAKQAYLVEEGRKVSSGIVNKDQKLLTAGNTLPDSNPVGVVAIAVSKADSAVYTQVGKNMGGISAKQVNTFVRQGEKLVTTNPKVTTYVQDVVAASKAVSGSTPASNAIHETQVLATIGKYKGKEAVLERLLPLTKSPEGLKTLDTIGSNPDLLYMVETGTNVNVANIVADPITAAKASLPAPGPNMNVTMERLREIERLNRTFVVDTTGKTKIQGAHGIEKHVGKRNEYLEYRIRPLSEGGEGKTAATSILSEEKYVNQINGIMKSNWQELDIWVRGSTNTKSINIQPIGNRSIIGRTIEPNMNYTKLNTESSFIKFKKNKFGGYYIITSY